MVSRYSPTFSGRSHTTPGYNLGSLECFSAGFRFGSDPLGEDLSGDAPADAAGCKDTCESGPISADSKFRGRLNIYGEPFDFS